jgi:uncharacterized protein
VPLNVRPGWIVLAFVATALAFNGAVLFVAALAHVLPPGPPTLDSPKALATPAMLLGAGAAATLVAWFLGQRLWVANPRTLLPGFAAGAVLLTLSVGAGALASGGVSAGMGDAVCALKHLAFIGPAAVAEELLLRGSGLRALCRAIGPPAAIIGGGVIFGLLHLGNPGASPVAAANVALVGIWFGAMAWRAQSIWPAVGAHLAWNFFEGFVWGQNVSGIRAGCSLLTATSRPPFFGGGPFGPEASGLTCLLLVLACLGTAFWPAGGRATASPGPAAQ